MIERIAGCSWVERVADLLEEAFPEGAIRHQSRVWNLDHDLAFERAVPGEIDRPHPPSVERFPDLVAIVEELADERVLVLRLQRVRIVDQVRVSSRGTVSYRECPIPALRNRTGPSLRPRRRKASRSRCGGLARALLLALKLLPKNAMSRGVGWLASRALPPPLQRFEIRLFARIAGVNLAEARDDVRDFATLQQFFTRALVPGARPIEGDEQVLVSPCDGAWGEAGRVPLRHDPPGEGAALPRRRAAGRRAAGGSLRGRVLCDVLSVAARLSPLPHARRGPHHAHRLPPGRAVAGERPRTEGGRPALRAQRAQSRPCSSPRRFTRATARPGSRWSPSERPTWAACGSPSPRCGPTSRGAPPERRDLSARARRSSPAARSGAISSSARRS